MNSQANNDTFTGKIESYIKTIEDSKNTGVALKLEILEILSNVATEMETFCNSYTMKMKPKKKIKQQQKKQKQAPKSINYYSLLSPPPCPQTASPDISKRTAQTALKLSNLQSSDLSFLEGQNCNWIKKANKYCSS